MHFLLVLAELVWHYTLEVAFIAGQDPIEMILLHMYPKTRAEDSDSEEI